MPEAIRVKKTKLQRDMEYMGLEALLKLTEIEHDGSELVTVKSPSREEAAAVAITLGKLIQMRDRQLDEVMRAAADQVAQEISEPIEVKADEG